MEQRGRDKVKKILILKLQMMTMAMRRTSGWEKEEVEEGMDSDERGNKRGYNGGK